MAKKKKKSNVPEMDLSVGSARGSLASKVGAAYSPGGSGVTGSGVADLAQGIASLGMGIGQAIHTKRNTKEGLEKRAERKEKKEIKKVDKGIAKAEKVEKLKKQGKDKRAERVAKKGIKKFEKADKLQAQAADLRKQAAAKDTSPETKDKIDQDPTISPTGGTIGGGDFLGNLQQQFVDRKKPTNYAEEWGEKTRKQLDETFSKYSTPMLKSKSPMKYNAALVRAVTDTYKQQSADATLVPNLISSIGKTVIGGLGQLRKASDEFAQQGRATRTTIDTDLEGVTSEHMIPYINDLKDQFDAAMKLGGKLFASPRQRSKQLEEITRVENAIKNLKAADEHIKMLRSSVDADLDFISEAHNDQQRLTYDTIASHGAMVPMKDEKGQVILGDDGQPIMEKFDWYSQLTYNPDNGTFMIQNPMGAQGDLIDIRQLPRPETIDEEFLDRERQLKRAIKNNYPSHKWKDGEVEEEIHSMYTKLYRSSPESIYDDPDFDEFLDLVYTAGSEEGVQPFEELANSVNIQLFEEDPSAFWEAHYVEGDEELSDQDRMAKTQERLGILKNSMKGVNLIKHYVAFKTGKGVNLYSETGREINQELNRAVSILQNNPDLKLLKIGTASTNQYVHRVPGGFALGTASGPHDRYVENPLTLEQVGLSQKGNQLP